jgi:hypothetical protein
VITPLASFLRSYQLGGGYTPGPLLALATLAGLAGTASLARRRATPGQRHAAQACLLMFTSAAAVLLISDAFEYSWRYQLPVLITLPPAAALAITALFTHRRQGPGAPPVTPPAAGSQTDIAAHAVPGPAGHDGGQGHGRGQELPQARDRTPAS